MAGEILYFLHRHFRIAGPMALAGGVAGMVGLMRWVHLF